jgi:hypothetical protein
VSANACSAVVWFGLFHLVFANTVIGCAESEILRVFKIDNKVFRVIVANYISMIVGYLIVAPLFLHPQFGRDILSVELTDIFIAFGVSFLATIAIEYPLFIWSLREKSQRRQLFIPFLVANIITNLIMLGIYLLIR